MPGSKRSVSTNTPKKIIADQLAQTVDGSTVDENIVKEHVDGDTTVRCHFQVSPAFGQLTKAGFTDMDKFLKSILYLTFTTIDKFVEDNGPESLTWDVLVSMMDQNVTVQPRAGSEDIYKTDHKSLDEAHWFSTHEYAEQSTSDEVNRWLHEFLADPEFVAIVGEDNLKAISDLFATRGSNVDSFAHVFANNDDHHRTLLDVGIIRIPDITHPYIRLFRIKIEASSHDQRYFVVYQNDCSTLTADLNVKEYQPRPEILEKIKPEILDKAAAAASDMFEDILGDL